MDTKGFGPLFVFLMAGYVCQVQSTDYMCENNDNMDAMCKNPASNSDALCSGRGDCICGMCQCHARRPHSAQTFTGRYCHCDDYSCPYSDDKMCGGRGRCDCGECRCDPGFTGDACDCPLSNDTCTTSDEKVCNGAGTCKCGFCTCNPEGPYKGLLCEECPTCPGGCMYHRDCALCVASAKGRGGCESECSQVGFTTVSIVDDIDRQYLGDGELVCRLRDDRDDCILWFTYRHYIRDWAIQRHLNVQGNRECPKPNVTEPSAAHVITPGLLTVVFGSVAHTILRVTIM